MKKKNHLWGWIKTISLFALLLVISVIVSHMAARFFPDDTSDGSATTSDAALALVEGIVGIIGACLVVNQLRSDTEAEIGQYNTQQARFVFEYNQAFIENKEMTEIERYLESRITNDHLPYPLNTPNWLKENRQKLINYLVYLEGLATCVLSGSLSIEIIDDIFAYRFFLAMNHKEVLDLELIKFKEYYQGCFALYIKWYEWRKTSPKYNHIFIKAKGQTKNISDLKKIQIDGCWYVKWEKNVDPNIKRVCLPLSSFAAGIDMVLSRLSAFFRGEEPKEITHPEKLEEFLWKHNFIRRQLEEQGRIKIIPKNKAKNFDIPLLTSTRAKIFDIKGEFLCEQLNQESTLIDDHLSQIAELIYSTDDYIYPDMFGPSSDTAKKVLPSLFSSKKDTMFRYENLFVRRDSNGKILGLILWIKGPLHWSPDALKDAFKTAGCPVPEKLDQVSLQYMNGYENVGESIISILNVCVDQVFRRQGIASEMMDEFVKDHAAEQLELCVLTDNDSAIKLYKSCGFEIIGTEPAYSSDSGKKRYNMVRKTQERN